MAHILVMECRLVCDAVGLQLLGYIEAANVVRRAAFDRLRQLSEPKMPQCNQSVCVHLRQIRSKSMGVGELKLKGLQFMMHQTSLLAHQRNGGTSHEGSLTGA